MKKACEMCTRSERVSGESVRETKGGKGSGEVYGCVCLCVCWCVS